MEQITIHKPQPLNLNHQNNLLTYKIILRTILHLTSPALIISAVDALTDTI